MTEVDGKVISNVPSQQPSTLLSVASFCLVFIDKTELCSFNVQLFVISEYRKHFLVPSALPGIGHVIVLSYWELLLSVTLASMKMLQQFLKCCSQHAYILKLLRDQGISQMHLDKLTVFHAVIMSKIRYALCAWGNFWTRTQKGMIISFLHRIYNVFQ